MSQIVEGLQFTAHPETQKKSSSHSAKEIISAALASLDPHLVQQLQNEKNWRKNYPIYFKALVEYGIQNTSNPIQIAKAGLAQAQKSFQFYRDNHVYALQDLMQIPNIEKLHRFSLKGQSNQAPEWYIPYHNKQLRGADLLKQLDTWLAHGIIEQSHADALRLVQAHPEWLDLSQRYMVLFGAASEAGPLKWLAKWKANIIAIDLPNPKVWQKIVDTVMQGNATLIAPSRTMLSADSSAAQAIEHLGANLLTQTAEIAKWLSEQPEQLDLAAIAYLDGEKHVRVSMAMDSIMHYVSQQKPDTSLMYMCTPTDIYAIPADVIQSTPNQIKHRSKLEKICTKGISQLSLNRFFQTRPSQIYPSNNQKSYAIADCIVIEQGPNYALAKRLQQWRATLARHQGQQVSINIAPSTTTHSVTKNPLLKAAFSGASLFNVEAFEPDTTNAIMAALWVHDLCNPQALANPNNQLAHPLELIMDAANHGGLWRINYLARTALPFAALYGFAKDKLGLKR